MHLSEAHAWRIAWRRATDRNAVSPPSPGCGPEHWRFLHRPQRHRLAAEFAARIDAEAYLADRRRQIDADLWNSQSAEKPQRVTFGAYAAAWLANRQVAGRPIKARTREHYNAILDDHLLPAFGNRQLAAIKPKEVRDWYAATLTDRPTMRSHAYSLLRTIMSSAVTDELIDANPCRIVGAGRAKRVHKSGLHH